MHELRVDLDTASRDELVEEINRLLEICNKWSSSWKMIVAANAEGWENRVKDAEYERDVLRKILNARIEAGNEG